MGGWSEDRRLTRIARSPAHRPVTSRTELLTTAVQRLVDSLEARFAIPGAVLHVLYGADGQHASVALGVDAEGRPLTDRSLFPVASGTKLAVGLLVLRLVAQGRIALDDRVGDVFAGVDAGLARATVRQVMSHQAGLPADVPEHVLPYDADLTWPALRHACLGVGPVHPIGERVVYSNQGYAVLAAVVEEVSCTPFVAALRTMVLDPLGIDAVFGADDRDRAVTVADVRSPYRDTALEPFNSPFWRRLGLPTIGMFTNAPGLLSLLGCYGPRARAPEAEVPGPRLLPAELAAEAVSDQGLGRPGGFPGGEAFHGFSVAKPIWWPECPWGLAAELRGSKRPHWAGGNAAPESFGHIGLTGCIVWCDPVANVSWALLGSRTADCGWLLRRGEAITNAVLASAAVPGC